MKDIRKGKIIIPKEFFTRIRPTISAKEALSDVIPVEWKIKDDSQKEKVIVYSAKEKSKIMNN